MPAVGYQPLDTAERESGKLGMATMHFSTHSSELGPGARDISMCNRNRVTAKQIEIAKQYGFDVDKLMPEPERLTPPELFPKKPGWVVRKHEGALSPEVMTWGIPRHMKGKSGKPVVSYVTNV